MTIAKNPKRNSVSTSEEQVKAFISGAGQAAVAVEPEQNKKPIMIRVDPDMINRIDRAAKRLGISRSAFIVSSTAVRLESME
jgi:predicted HicB family RNase H-like nuclease